MARFRRELLNGFLILLGVLSAGMGLKGFLFSSNFIDGGVTGVSMLLDKVTHLHLALWLPLINFPFILVAYRQIGWAFALRSALAIAALAFTLVFVPFPNVTADLLLTAVFGGLFIGSGIGLAIRGGAALDGTEIAALLISKRVRTVKVGEVILLFNAALFVIALTVLGVEQCLYSILTYAAASKAVNFIVYGLEEYTAVTIVSGESRTIRERITLQLGRGVTILRGLGAMKNLELEILYCVVTRLEVASIQRIINEVDSQAFVTIHGLSNVQGGIIRRSLNH